jgi:hypothetical protein
MRTDNMTAGNQQNATSFDAGDGAKPKIVGMSNDEAFQYAQELADLDRPLIPRKRPNS